MKMEVKTPAHLTYTPFTGSFSHAELAHNLHQYLSLSQDVLASNQASLDIIEKATITAGASGFASVTTQLADTNTKLGSHVNETLGAIKTATTAISEFADAVKTFEEDFGELNKRIEVIRSLTEQVSSIARESALLSVNARIESARAGAQGAGFTVVAEQVGALAQTTQNISKKISQDVDSIYESLERFSSRFTATQSSLGHAHVAIEALDETAGGILEEANHLNNITEEIEGIAYNQVEIQSYLERIGRHSEWVKQSASALAVGISSASQAADFNWKSVLPPQRAQAVDSMQSFEDQFARALDNDEPHTAHNLVEWAIREKLPAGLLLSKVSNAANRVFLKQVGQDLPVEVYFRNAQILQDAIERLEPLHTSKRKKNQAVVVLGNAFEDHHDLGRRIIAMAMRSAGFKVIDLGLSVSNETFVETARREKADVIGVSSLLLHTAKWIPRLKEQLLASGLGHVKIIVGGAPFMVDPHLRDVYKADGVGRSPDDAIRLVKSIMAEKALREHQMRGGQ